MSKIKYENCGNIREALIDIVPNKINIKYGNNGIGKSTLGKALLASIRGENELLKRYIPFGTNKTPVISHGGFKSILYFDTEYVENYLFKEDIINNSFEIITKTSDYETKIQNIHLELAELKEEVNNENISTVMEEIRSITESIKFNNKNDFDGKSTFAKGIKNINIDKDVEDNHKEYINLIKSPNNFLWIDWFKSGKNYITDTKCPFCLSALDDNFEELHESITKTFNKQTFKNSAESNAILSNFKKYTSQANADKILGEQNKGEISAETKNIIKTGVELLSIEKSKLEVIKNLDPITLLDLSKDELSSRFNSLKINSSLFKEVSADLYEKMENINNKLTRVIEKINDLNKQLSMLKSDLAKKVNDISGFVNNFLVIAGIPYQIQVIINGNDDAKTILKHKSNEEIKSPKRTLSFGELNSLSLMLFCVQAISETPDIVVLDDPVSSFDGNKKYAIMHQLFSSSVEKNLRGQTVLLLTHDFTPVIDFVYNSHPTGDNVKAWNLYYEDGIIYEQSIEKSDIISCVENELVAAKNTNNNIVKRVVSLRNYYDMTLLNNSTEYSILSSLLHLRNRPTNKDGNEISVEELNNALLKIKENIIDFDYNKLYNDLNDISFLKKIYKEGDSLDKIYITRILLNMKPEFKNDKVLWKFLNESFHSENSYFYNLNNSKFKTIPEYIIDSCDNLIERF